MNSTFDTIAAVSTPFGKGGIAVIRISGADAIEICSKIFVPTSKKYPSLASVPSRYAVYGEIMSCPEGFSGAERYVLDTGLATVFSSPNSFTGEETVEISCHGGVLVTRNVLSAFLFAGARLAEAGEFTRRAFVNGKMGLSAAEALGSLLDAKTDEQLSVSRSGLNGTLERRSGEIYSDFCKILSSVYAKIDYPDEDLAEMSRDEIICAVKEVKEKAQNLADTYRTGRAICEGVRTVICGKTNVGKSSIYNLLVGHDAAIVTDIEGTTRDILSQDISLGKVALRLFDTAGLRNGYEVDRVEQIGIERAEREIENAELVFAVFDGSRPTDNEDRQLAQRLKRLTSVAVINKSDLPQLVDEDFISASFDFVIHLCAYSPDNIAEREKLQTIVEKLFIDESINTHTDAVIVNARQYAAVIGAVEASNNALQALENDFPLDACCIDIEAAMSSIGCLDGRQVEQDIVNSIFSKFCVGK